MTSLHERIEEELVGVRVAGVESEVLAGGSLVVTDPTTGGCLAQVLTGDAHIAAKAVEVASSAAAGWASTPGPARAEALRGVAAALRAQSERLARIVVLETGKRLAEARAEVGLSAGYFDWFATAAEAHFGQIWELRPGVTHEVRMQPVGVSAVLTPWNFPVSIPARKLAAALGAGCPALFKPSEVAPLSGLALAEVLEAHLPPGVVSTLVGDAVEIVGAWLADRRVRAVSFTGSTRVGALIAAQAAPSFTRTVLELGGSAPVVILPGADPAKATEVLLGAKLRNNGQSCIAANTAWVHVEAIGELLARLEAAFDELVVGDPLEEATGLGPTCLPGDPGRLEELVGRAQAQGAKRIGPGREAIGETDGFFFPPTLLVMPDPSAELLHQEIFGPVLYVVGYRDLKEALAYANSSPYGLAGYVVGEDLGVARRVAAALDVGLVGINTFTPNTPQVPFAPRGDSGLGVEGSLAGMEQFMRYQTLAAS